MLSLNISRRVRLLQRANELFGLNDHGSSHVSLTETIPLPLLVVLLLAPGVPQGSVLGPVRSLRSSNSLLHFHNTIEGI